MYNQQKADGLGDFISLAIINGFVEFKYDLGNGPVLIRSIDKIQLNQFHRVVIKRYHRDGILKLDEGEDVAGQARGSLKALDLLEDTFIGFVPTIFDRYVIRDLIIKFVLQKKIIETIFKLLNI